MSKQAIVKQQFPSSSSAAVYEAVRWTDGSYSCNCPAWRFKREGQERSCKHVKQMAAGAKPNVVNSAAAIAKAVETTSAATAAKVKTNTANLLGTSKLPPFIKPMLAPTTGIALEAIPKNAKHLIAEPKFDGHRAVIHIAAKKAIAVYSRKGNDMLSSKANGTGWIADIVWPFNSGIVDAELIFGTGLAQAAANINDAKSIAGLDTSLIIFDLLEFEGADLKHERWFSRRAQLELAFEGFKNPRVQITPYSLDPFKLWEEWVEKLGGEGIMLKTRDSKYEPGVRSPYWFKVKGKATVKVVITGVTDKDAGGRKFKAVGCALTYGFYDKQKKKVIEVGQGGPGMYGNPDDLKQHIGKIAEMRCYGVMSSGALRSGQFLRWRDDIEISECVMPGK